MGELDLTRIALVVGAVLIVWKLFGDKLGLPSFDDIKAKLAGNVSIKPQVNTQVVTKVNTVELVQEWNKFRSNFTKYADASGNLPAEIQNILDKVDALYVDLNIHIAKKVA